MSTTPIVFVIGIWDNQWDCSHGCLLRKSCNSHLIGQRSQQYTNIVYALHSFCIVKTDHICHAQYSNYRYIAATHNITMSMHIKMHYTTTTIHSNFIYLSFR